MKHIKYFREFLADEVNLNPTRLNRLNKSSKAVNTYLRDNLDGYEKNGTSRFLWLADNHQTCR